MKYKLINLLLLIVTLTIVADTATAQRRRTSRSRSGGGSAYGNSSGRNTGSQPSTNSNNTNTQPSGYGGGNQLTGNTNSAYGGASANNTQAIDTTLPMEVIQNTSGGLLDSVKMSLRNDAAVERNLIKDRTPLVYEHIREDDAVYRVRIWREIDTREKMNKVFHYAAVEDNGGQRFISILLKAIKEEGVVAFGSDDDRFTTPITAEQAIGAFGGGFDTSRKYDMEGNVAGYQVRPKAVDPDSIYKFRLKEEWIFDKESSRMHVRILGIAPVVSYKLSTGEVIPNSERAVFWVYYPDLRSVLAKYEVYNAKNFGARMTWEELFESRMFTSYITKSTMDNPSDIPLSAYIKDPLFRLLEGENVKEKIFNYEQSLWSY